MSDDIEERLRAAYQHRAEQVDATPDLDDLAARERASVRKKPPWWRRRAGRLVVVGALAAGSLGWAAVEVLQSVPVESPFNPGGELDCSGIQTMTPAEAEAELRDRGYEVQWQYHPTSGSKAIRERPPAADDTVVVEVVILEDEPALILVEGFNPDDPEHRRLRAGITLCAE